MQLFNMDFILMARLEQKLPNWRPILGAVVESARANKNDLVETNSTPQLMGLLIDDRVDVYVKFHDTGYLKL